MMPPSYSRRGFLRLSSLLPFALLPLSGKLPEGAANNQNSTQKNILIFVFDALSARHIPMHGYSRNTTPNLTRFAERAMVYHSHHAGGNFTTSGTASLLTGAYPWSHRAIHLYGTVREEFNEQNIFAAYPGNGFTFAYTHNLLAETLIQQFRGNIDLLKRIRELAIFDPEYSDRLFAADFAAASWSEQLIMRGSDTKPSSLFASLIYRALRLSQSKKIADTYGRQFPRGIPNVGDMYYLLEDAVDWLISELNQTKKPYLGYFHILPPHEPYYPRKEFIGIFKDDFRPTPKPASPFTQHFLDKTLDEMRLKYDENIAYADAEFGRLLDAMAHQGILDNTIVIVTADHGELFERGIAGHETAVMYEPLLHIPLLISVPGQSQRQDIKTPTSCVDLLPTLAKITGQPVPAWAEGQVLPGFNNEEGRASRSIYSVEAKSSAKMGPLNKATIALFKENYKYIDYRGYAQNPPNELYDLASDPEELQDLAASKKSLAAELKQEIDNRLRQTNSF